MPQYAPDVTLSPRQRVVLEALARSSKAQQRHVERASIVLASADGALCVEIAVKLGVDEQRVRRWRRRFAAAMEILASAEAQDATDDDLRSLIIDVISDDARTGGPPKVTAEQWSKIAALACESPSKLGLPLSHWTPGELSRQAKKLGIADVSERHVARFLKGGVHSASQVAVLAQPQHRRPSRVRRGRL